jgi:predicted acetyltransferase
VTLRLADPHAVTAELAKVYDAVQPGQPGFFVRDDDWWGRVLHDESQERPGRDRCAACSPRTRPACAATPFT